MKTYTIGVDLGGTNIKAGLVDEVHHIVDSVSCKTNLPRPEHEVEAEIAALCSQLAQRAGLDMATQIESVGIGTDVYKRQGLETDTTDIMGIQLPCTVIPVMPGRNLAVILEAAAINNRQKKRGYNAARELLARLGLDEDDPSLR